MKESDNENRSTSTSNGVVIVDDGLSTIGRAKIAYTCQICGNDQEIEYYIQGGFYTMCDQCKSDLKEIILNKRNKQGKFLGEDEKSGQ